MVEVNYSDREAWLGRTDSTEPLATSILSGIVELDVEKADFYVSGAIQPRPRALTDEQMERAEIAMDSGTATPDQVDSYFHTLFTR